MNQRKITVALAQFEPRSGQLTSNLETMHRLVRQAAREGADIICFPELAYTGYYLPAAQMRQLAEPVDGPFVTALQSWAAEERIHIIAGYAEEDTVPGRIFNACAFVDDEGALLCNTRKFYLWGKEKAAFAPGDRFAAVRTKFGTIGLLICYDAEFPEPFRILALKGAELVFVPSAWSVQGRTRWGIDMTAGALYNLLHVVGVNLTDARSCGSSMAVNPDGVVEAMAGMGEELLLHTLDLEAVRSARGRIPYFSDFRADTFSMEALQRY